MKIASNPAGAGWAWIHGGWTLLRKDFGNLFLMFLVMLALSIAINILPFIGYLLSGLLMIVLTGGYMHAAQKLDNGEDISIGDLFEGFRDKSRLTPLLLLGIFYLLVQIVIVMLVFGIMGDSAMLHLDSNTQTEPSGVAMPAGMLLGMSVGLLGAALLSMIITFAPALVMLDGASPFAAMKGSLQGVLRNILPMAVFGLIGFLLTILAMIPMGLGMLILLPVMLLSVYRGYTSIYHR